MKIAGQRRGESYPSPTSAAASALQNREVAATPISLTAPFTPVPGGGSLVAAVLFTPRVSGVIQVTALMDAINGAAPDIYGLSAIIFSGTGLTLSGGEISTNGWVAGTNTPPIVGGAGIAPVQILGVDINQLVAGEQAGLSVAAAISQPLPIGVPVAIEIILTEVGGGNPLAGPIAFFQLSVLELP